MGAMGAMQPSHWLIVIVVLAVLFGAKRLPDAARSLGKSARILKAEVGGLHDDQAKPAEAQSLDAKPAETRSVAQAAQTPPAQTQPSD